MALFFQYFIISLKHISVADDSLDILIYCSLHVQKILNIFPIILQYNKIGTKKLNKKLIALFYVFFKEEWHLRYQIYHNT